MRVSKRAKLLRLWRYRWKRVVQFSDDSDEEEFGDIRAALESSRYMGRPRYYFSQHNCPELSSLLSLRPKYFRQQTRMTQQTFVKFLSALISNPIFHNESHHQQRHPGIQLFVFLQTMGHDGNGLVTISVSGMQNIGDGTVALYVSRVAKAIRDLHSKLLKWPGPRTRKRMSARFFAKFGFYSFGILDGTFVYFNQAPSIDPECFFTRKKKNYGMNCQLICNLDWRIIGYVVGWPGCTPDTTAYESSDFFTRSSEYFSQGESLLADKGYCVRSTLTVPYDEPELQDTLHSTQLQKQLYNDGLKKARLLIERVNAMLKNRFTWLKGMRFQVRCREDFEKCNEIVISLLILHNFMMSELDVWTDGTAPVCDEWLHGFSEAQANVAAGIAKAASNMTQREQDLYTRLQRHQTFLLWKEKEATDAFFV
jgi:hypothetical protein